MKELDRFEKQIEEELEKGGWKRVKNFEEVKAKLQDTAKATLQKKKLISIRISERDLALLKRKSVETGIPYQTLISTLIKQYVEGKIKLHL